MAFGLYKKYDSALSGCALERDARAYTHCNLNKLNIQVLRVAILSRAAVRQERTKLYLYSAKQASTSYRFYNSGTYTMTMNLKCNTCARFVLILVLFCTTHPDLLTCYFLRAWCSQQPPYSYIQFGHAIALAKQGLSAGRGTWPEVVTERGIFYVQYILNLGLGLSAPTNLAVCDDNTCSR